MSNLKEASTCPDGYRALSASELRELLQNDDKMDQIIRLNEKVGILRAPPKNQSAESNLLCVGASLAVPPIFLAQFLGVCLWSLLNILLFVVLIFGVRCVKQPSFQCTAHRLSAWRAVGFPIRSH